MTFGNTALMSSNAANTPNTKTTKTAESPVTKVSKTTPAKKPVSKSKSKWTSKAKTSTRSKTPSNKAPSKKTTAKKTTAIKTVSKNIAVKPVTKKNLKKKADAVKAKAEARAKAAERINAAARAKAAAKKKAAASAKAVNKSKPVTKSPEKRATVSSLAKQLKVLEQRVNGTHKKSRLAISELEKTVSKIKTSGRKGPKSEQTALSRRLGKLETQLESYLERSASEARAGVRKELSAVTKSGANLTTFENAIEAATNRLDEMDQAQRSALARINRHIADLATSIETRLTAETRARAADTAKLDAKINTVRDHVDQRIEKVEEETASALEAVGEKVAEFAAVLDQRAKASDSETAERLADLAQETHSDFSAAQSEVTARLEALEVIASAWSPSQDTANPYLPANEDDPRIDQMGEMIASLQEELSRMHARIATVQQASPAPVTAPVSGPIPAPSNVLPMTAAIQDNPYAAAAQALETTKLETPPPPQAMPQKMEATAQRDSHIPQEFDPAAFAPKSIPQPAIHAVRAPSSEPSTSLMPPALTAPAPPPMASVGAHSAPAQNPINQAHAHQLEASLDPLAADSPMTAPLPVSTYDDPAYAEADDMRAERIGDTGAARKSRVKLPVSGRNLRVGGLALGVAVVGLFAAKTILGGPDNGGNETRLAEIQNAPEKIAAQDESFGTRDSNLSQSISTPDVGGPPIAPLNQYAETRTPSFGSEAENTLDAAVAAGNPIAQFQKGLVQLQTGNLEEGARLIRLAANRNQPAAQYRLAKLYETATGVAKDEVTARELIERAARGGNRIAMHDLGNYHALGQGELTQDMSAALDWFTKAAERGVVDSQFNVAYLREGNEGVAADLETALFWYHVAARQGDPGAPDRVVVLSERIDAGTQAQIKARADRFNPKPVDEAANGIFRNVAWAKPAQTNQTAQSAQILKIRDAQTLLSELGYQVGTPDGISGKKTREAVKSFEAVNGLPETGQITDELIERLEIAAGA